MDVSVTELRQRCHEIIREIERSGAPVTVSRRGKVVACIVSASAPRAGASRPWERLQAMGGQLLAEPGESAFR